ncbi:kinase-like protein [Cylindrobasidium torrendii FP15055 ss-10]|uniref:non-specific serine/threonine protein kinase n=1 Tax=Cylindrobasidium torrendii FP15055 ss-10 TaxID=1314674 RepID=A0A0D7B798_9AGAR|nr:kinase-like protein [Cylindrobasidium torrendii FP15055 ss-10]
MLRLLSAARGAIWTRFGHTSFRSASTIAINRVAAPLPPDRDQAQFHPVSKGELLSGRYEAVRNLGCGAYSTVWLARDIQAKKEVAIKLMAASLTDEKRGPDELGIMSTLRDSDLEAAGRRHVCLLLDSFVHSGPNGDHVCLVLEPLGLSALDIYRSFGKSLPLIVVQRIARHILLGLQYMHECGIVHTDIKGDNIMLTGAGFGDGQTKMDLPIDALFQTDYKLTDFGSANRVTKQWAAVIQPLALRSPEVLIGAPWDTKTDIWNFGCMMHEFASGSALFDPTWDNEGSGLDHTQTHLAQIVGLLGDFPKAFRDQGTKSSKYFNTQGGLIKPGMYGITLKDLLSQGGHPQDELAIATDFLEHALIIDPSQRWSASQLLEHPWMKSIINF